MNYEKYVLRRTELFTLKNRLIDLIQRNKNLDRSNSFEEEYDLNIAEMEIIRTRINRSRNCLLRYKIKLL